MSTTLTLLLVLLGAGSLGYIAVSTFITSVMEDAANAREDEGNVSALRKLVSPTQMAKYRINAGFAVAIAVFLILTFFNFKNGRTLFVSVLLGTIAAYMPVVYYRRKVASRRELFNSQILELTNGIAAGMRAGQAFPAALEAVQRRIQWPMNEELETVMRENRLGIDMPEALERMNKRQPSEDLALIVGAVKLTAQAGGSLSQVMEKMTQLIRARNDFQERLKNLTAQGKFEAIAMSLMPIFVFVILFFEDRPLVMPLITTNLGWTAIGAVVFMVTCGYLWIRKIVTIEV